MSEPECKIVGRRRELTLQEAARRIEKHYITTLKLARSGKLRAYKKGGQWYVPEEEVERFNREGNYPGSDIRLPNEKEDDDGDE